MDLWKSLKLKLPIDNLTFKEGVTFENLIRFLLLMNKVGIQNAYEGGIKGVSDRIKVP